jgi:AcrR family transcriptional regulator
MPGEELERSSEPAATTDGGKRRQVLDGACRVFLRLGFDAASMGTIAKEAGVSKGTLYVYFKSKEELFEAIVEEQRLQEAEQIFALDEAADIETELTRFGVAFARFLCRPDGLPALRTVMAISDRMPELGARFYAAGPARGAASLSRYLAGQIAGGVLKPHDNEVTAAQFLDACVSTIFKPMLFNCAGPPDDAQIRHVVQTAVHTFLSAYRTR